MNNTETRKQIESVATFFQLDLSLDLVPRLYYAQVKNPLPSPSDRPSIGQMEENTSTE